MTALTIPMITCVLIAMWRPRLWPIILAVAGAAPAGAALVFGGLAIPTFYFAACAATIVFIGRILRLLRPPSGLMGTHPGMNLMIAFGFWATTVTLLSPVLFPGLKVYDTAPRSVTLLEPGMITSSNVAQVGYLWMGIAVISITSNIAKTSPHLVGVTLTIMMLLCLWRLSSDFSGVWFPERLFDNNSTLDYIETAPGGAPRFRGILSEPAGLAVYCMAASSYALAAIPRVRRIGQVCLVAGLIPCVWMGLVSTSTTFLIAGSIMLSIAVVAAAIAPLVQGRRVSIVRTLTGIIVLISIWIGGQTLWGYLSTALNEKSGTSSYSDRSTVNNYAFDVFRDSYGVGAGLGANRPASLFTTLLSCVGVIGTLLFVAAVLAIIWRARRSETIRPTLWTLGSLLVCKLISGPDLSDPSGLLYLCLGILLGAGLTEHANEDGGRLRAEGQQYGHDEREPAIFTGTRPDPLVKIELGAYNRA